MLNNFSKSILLAGCLLAASVVLAAQHPTAFGLGHTSTQAKPLSFNCTVVGNTVGTVYFRDIAVLITVFNSGGQLYITPTQLNTVYFNSYHDTNFPSTINGYVVGEITGAKKPGLLVCQYGQGIGRSLEPGTYGVATP